MKILKVSSDRSICHAKVFVLIPHDCCCVVRSEVKIAIVKAPNLAENSRYFGRTFLRFEFYQKIQK